MKKKELTRCGVLTKRINNSTPQASLECSNSGVVLSGKNPKQKYNKPALSLNELAELMLERGVKGITVDELKQRLRFVSYYRLRGYTYIYQDNAKEDAPFKPGTQWKRIWDDYCFDQDLRMLMFDGISRYEIAFRSVVVATLSEEYGGQWYEETELFESDECCKDLLKELDALWKRSKEEFKEHYLSSYDDSVRPPAWMMFETATMGIVNKIYSKLKNSLEAKKSVLHTFGFKRADVFISWNHHLNYVRNICAHHARLFSKKLVIKPLAYKRSGIEWGANRADNASVYASICILVRLLSYCMPEYQFVQRIQTLLSNASFHQREIMHLPDKWDEELALLAKHDGTF